MQLFCANTAQQWIHFRKVHPGNLTANYLPAGEVAIVDSTELKLLIGSQDATTCVVAILACPVTAMVWAAHLDSTLGHLDVQDLQSILQQMQQPQLFMVGGYCTEHGQGPSEYWYLCNSCFGVCQGKLRQSS
jgi:hypothetical protein